MKAMKYRKTEEILLEKHQVTKALIHIEPYHMEKGS